MAALREVADHVTRANGFEVVEAADVLVAGTGVPNPFPVTFDANAPALRAARSGNNALSWSAPMPVLAAAFADVVAPYDPTAINFPDLLKPPSPEHLLGADNFGRDVLSRVIFGSRTALLVGFTLVFLLAIGVTGFLLEAIRLLGMEKKTRFYQASTSELYGLVQETPQKETTPFYPRSPYAVAKLYAYWITVNYRESYGMYACNGILFNHESPRRGETFVTRKITRGLANIGQGLEKCLYMGNLDALRDWGHAKDYVRMQWMMLQQDTPEDFVIATGVQYSVREFIRWSAAELGVELRFEGEGVDERAIVERVEGDMAPSMKPGDVVVAVDPRYFRPAEVETLLGDPSKAREKLGWVSEISVQQMCAEMVAEDLKVARRHALLKHHGYQVPISMEHGT